MVPFAGYEMPVQYEGIMAEHLWTRENAGLFDVSHMGQLFIHGPDVAGALEELMPGDFRAAPDMKPKYSLLLDNNGGTATPLDFSDDTVANGTLGFGATVGTLTAGKWADFLVLDADPLVDITNTRAISDVYIAGNKLAR